MVQYKYGKICVLKELTEGNSESCAPLKCCVLTAESREQIEKGFALNGQPAQFSLC